jgi:hypothetical protein
LVGGITLAWPLLRDATRQWQPQEHPLPRPGLVCWRVERATSTGSIFGTTCKPAAGWHLEEWPGIGPMPVPDDARMARRQYTFSEER